MNARKTESETRARIDVARKPVIIVVDPSIDITGALVAARREATALADVANMILAVSPDSRAAGTEFPETIHLAKLYPDRSFSALLTFPFFAFFGAVRLKREITARGCERVQFNDFYLVQSFFLRLLGFKGKIVTWVRLQPDRLGMPGRLVIAAANLVSSDIVVVSEYLKGCKYIPARSVVLHDSYDQSALRVRRCDPSRRQFSCIANYTPGKGHETAIKAFHKIAEQHPEAELAFFGSDLGRPTNQAYRRELQSLAKCGPGGSRISFHGQIANATAVYEYSFAAVNLSESESFSLSCLDACAAALPVIATRCGGPEEIIENGITGLLIPVGDSNAAAAAMSRLASDPHDAEAMGKRGRARAIECFSPGRLKMQLYDLWGFSADVDSASM